MKLALACGGTGGHIFPAFSLAQELRARRPETQIVYVCGKLDIESEIFRMVIREDVFAIESAPFRGARSLLSPGFLLKLLKGFVSALRFLRREKPDGVVGFGGYFSFPVVIAARLLGIRCVIHEQNVDPGVANRFLCSWADGVALSYEETLKFLNGRRRNLKVTGNPIRVTIEKSPSRREALSFFGFDEKKKTVLVLGGSQGAESINMLFLAALPHVNRTLKENMQALHLCGRMDPAEAERKLRLAGVHARAFSFFDRMDLAYAASDAAIGRAGATFLAEIASKDIPAVLVPYPFGNGHQKLNADIFARDHRAIVTPQADLSAEKMAAYLEKILTDPPAPKTRVPSSGARERLADFIEEVFRP